MLQILCSCIGLAQQAVRIDCDSQSAIFLAKNQTYNSKTKHIDIQYHFVRDMVEEKKVLLMNTVIRMTSTITLFCHKPVKPQIPLPWSLIQAIQALLQSAYQTLLPFDFIPMWLLHINLFLQIPMEKSCFYICSRCKSSIATRLKIVLIEVILTSGENISSKSIPFFCDNPFTTSLALYRFLPPYYSFKL